MNAKVAKITSTLLLSGALSFTFFLPAHAEMNDQLPEIGTTAGATLSIGQEKLMGDFYVRQLRASAPLIEDPLLKQYINKLGQSLVANAHSVKTPFVFFLVQSNEINAFAFFGGNVVLHSALLSETDNESQLAAVLAHEISHVTQRHLARAMEDQQHNRPLTWVGALGSVLLTMANPTMGMAALSGTLAGAQQSIISFTQANEQEADRIGLQVLQRSGFDPEAMPNFLQKLADRARYSSKPPEMLLTHPLPESRLSDTRNRANQMPRYVAQSSQDYFFAKVRALCLYKKENPQQNNEILNQYRKGNAREQLAAQYGKAILLYQNKKYDAAHDLMLSLLTQQPKNPWFLDLSTDIDLAQHQAPQAIARLLSSGAVQNSHPVLLLNLANAYIEGGQSVKALPILRRYTFDHPNDPNGWSLLSQAYAMQRLPSEEWAARAENLALEGAFDKAITLLSKASLSQKLGSLEQARYDARIDQLRRLQQQFAQFEPR